jgi:hypothetical protein
MRRSRLFWVLMALIGSAAIMTNEAAAQFGTKQKYLGVHVGVSGVGSAAALGLNGEVAYNDKIGIGAWFDTWSYGETFTGGEWNVRYVALAGTGAYHFPVKSNPKIDPFLGLAVGYFVVSTSSDVGGFSYDGSGSRIFIGGFGGARYHFKPNMSGVARLGFGAAYLTLGLDFKM